LTPLAIPHLYDQFKSFKRRAAASRLAICRQFKHLRFPRRDEAELSRSEQFRKPMGKFARNIS
jgi:hypothetical protein